MLNLTFATARAYNYPSAENEVRLVFKAHEIAREPGSIRFVCYGYRVLGGAFAGIYADVVLDVYNVRDTGAVLKCLFAAADKCIRDAYERFDVVFNLVDRNGDRWHPFNRIGRNLLAEAFDVEGVDVYPLTHRDVKRLAASDNVYPFTMEEVKEFLAGPNAY